MDQKDGATGVATAAKDQAGQVGQTATEAGGQVAQTAKEQVHNVVGETKQQARDLVGEARGQVRDQAGSQKSRAVDGLRSLAGELDQMAQQAQLGEQSGIATELARQAAQRAHGLADHLDRHEPGELLDQVRSYARRRPVAFLTGAAVLGVLAGRMTRNLAGDDGRQRQLSGPPTTPALPVSSYEPAAYGTGSAGYPAGYSAGAEATSAPGYEPGYEAGGYGTGTPSGGFRPAGEPGYEAGYESGYEPGYVPGSEPGTRPAGYESGAEDPAWRTP
jgi:hypothetical protein